MTTQKLCCVLFFIAFITVINGEILPSLEIQPNPVTKEVGGSLAVTCRPNVQDPSLVSHLEWRDTRGNKIEKSSGEDAIYTQALPGREPGLVLIFKGLTENMAGNYTCYGSYAGTEQIKATVSVSTYVEITFIDAPEFQYPIVGQDFMVKCKVKGNPSPIIDWSKNETSIGTDGKYIINNDELLIKNVEKSDSGVYKCTAVVPSTGTIKNRNIKVEVQVPPNLSKMEPVSIIEGETASVQCHASGSPDPSYTWIKERGREDLSITNRFDVKKTTGLLIINGVEINDDDTYKCIAENRAGRAETTVKINVLAKPKIYELLNVTSPTGSETKIICKTQGRPPPRVTFRKLSLRESYQVGQQPDNRKVVLEQQFFEEKGESFGILTVSNLNRSDDGLYQCIAENTAGAAYRNGHITVEFKPTFERTKDLPPVWSWDKKPGNLTCLPEAIPNATIIWRHNGIEITNDSAVFKVIGRGPHSFLIVEPHHDRRFYTNYECIASNKLGIATIHIPLKEAKIPGSIPQVKMQSVTATTIKFSIVAPSNFDGLPIRSYSVQYRPEREITWDYARNHTWSAGAPYILENLVPEVTYHFRFAARNDVGMGPFQNAESVTMPRRSEPAEPKILMAEYNGKDKDENSSNRQERISVSPYADHYELRWSVPNDNGDPIQHYLIRYCVTTKINGEWRDSDCSEEIQQSVQYTNFDLDHLLPDTVYKIELRAHNAIGDSSPAQIRVRTARGVDPVVPSEAPSMSSAMIIGIVVAAILLVLIVVDLTCFCVNRAGILALMCGNSKSKHHEEDPKLGSYKAAPAHPSSLNLPQPIKLAPTPTDEREPLKGENGERNMSVEYDGKHVYSKPGEIIGKHSAV